MEETLPNKGILKKPTREGKNLTFFYNCQQSWNPKQAKIVKHLIAYNNLKTYINPKGMIGMLVTSRHVWGHTCLSLDE
jgi:hypothetical protein